MQIVEKQLNKALSPYALVDSARSCWPIFYSSRVADADASIKLLQSFGPCFLTFSTGHAQTHLSTITRRLRLEKFSCCFVPFESANIGSSQFRCFLLERIDTSLQMRTRVKGC